MALYFNAGTNKLEKLPSPLNGTPMTFAGWIRRVNTGVAHTILQTSADVTESNGYRIEVTAAGVARCGHKSANANVSASAGTIADTNWHHVVGIFPSTASRTAYLDGTPGTAVTTAKAEVTETRILVGATYTGSALVQNTGMELADVAGWNDVLTDAEIAALAKGVSPALVRPNLLVFYAPLNGTTQDLRNNAAWNTETHSGFVAHPRIYMPATMPIIGVSSVSATTVAVTAGAMDYAEQGVSVILARVVAVTAIAMSYAGQALSVVRATTIAIVAGAMNYAGQALSLGAASSAGFVRQVLSIAIRLGL